ncbi:MAG: hypothetical protein J0L93_06670 [Deltaproteobacteria bacterium]|nr:hypothetical protein [Deltaproteobacteria bacterium]
MFEIFLSLIAVSFSLYLWGIIRTAIWLLPAILVQGLVVPVAAAWLSFWMIASFLTPYQSGSYDFRNLDRQKWILIFFLSGVFTGTLLYPSSLFAFALGAMIPLLFLKIFYLCRQPATGVVFLRRKTRWLLVFLWISCAMLRALEFNISL